MSSIIVNGYEVQGTLTSKDAGNSVWGAACKNDRQFFIKQLKETYLNRDYAKATPFQRQDMDASQRFYNRMVRMYSELRKSDNGNLVVPLEFIKQDGHYYIIAEWIEKFKEFKDVASLNAQQKEVLLKILAYNVAGLAANNIVHSDLKPDNLLLKVTSGGACTLKIIDFENSFISGDYPENIGGDQNYLSPEMLVRMGQDHMPTGARITITPKSDVFSLGIIFHEILTGEQPISCDPEVPYIGVAVSQGIDIQFSKNLSTGHAALIKSMLSKIPTHRPSAWDVFQQM